MTVVIPNENTDGFIRIIKSLKNSDALLDGGSQALKYSDMLLRNLVALLLRNMLTGNVMMTARKAVMRIGRRYKNMDSLDKNF